MKTSQALSALALTATLSQAGHIAKRGVAGTTTRYWDCCKASCSWSGKASFSAPVNTCDINDSLLSNHDATSGCDANGVAFMCSSQQPFAINDNLAYGFAAVTGGGSEADTCCACYKLTFTSQITGKVMIVQATNIGYDVSSTQFDLALPGGGTGAFPRGCQKQYDGTKTPSSGWGQQYGGVSSSSQCSSLPQRLQAGCEFRFGWLQGADNPTIQYERVACPAQLLEKSSCKRNDDGNYPAAPNGSGSTTSRATTTSQRTSTTTKQTTTTQRPATTTSTRQTTTTSSSGATQTHYGQCGRVGWVGPTKCVAGTTCQKQAGNDYYSQCL